MDTGQKLTDAKSSEPPQTQNKLGPPLQRQPLIAAFLAVLNEFVWLTVEACGCAGFHHVQCTETCFLATHPQTGSCTALHLSKTAPISILTTTECFARPHPFQEELR